MHLLQVQLTDELASFIDRTVQAGRYRDAEDVMREALRTLAREEERLACLRAAIAEGDASGLVEGDFFALARVESLATDEERP